MAVSDFSRINAALVAAASSTVSKRVGSRPSPPTTLPARFRFPAVQDIPSLLGNQLSPSSETHRKIARLTTASLTYALAKKGTQQVNALLESCDRAVLEELELLRGTAKKEATGIIDDTNNDRGCRYCMLLQRSLYQSKKIPPPVEIISHSAHVSSTFDSDANLATASIGFDEFGHTAQPYQLLLPKSIATKMIANSHPLNWKVAAPDLWTRSDRVVRADDGSFPSPPPKESPIEREAAKKNFFLLEGVLWPWNQEVEGSITNVLRITDLFSDARGLDDGHLRALEYDYSLESCLGSNFGVSAEPTGIDIDEGGYSGIAKPAAEITRGDVAYLTDRDIDHLGAANSKILAKRLDRLFGYPTPRKPKSTPKSMPAKAKIMAIKKRARELRSFWDEEFWFVSVSAIKKLRFTAMKNGPADLWSALTWTAPAVLFVFINRSVAQTPYFLLEDVFKQRLPKPRSSSA